MKGFKCTRNFPKRYTSQTMFDEYGFPNYRRRKTKHVVHVRNAVLDNQWVVPYNRKLLLRYNCHINLEACNHGRCMKYLFKYCLKGPDRATLCVCLANDNCTDNSDKTTKNEIKTILDGRYVYGAEAAHRLFGFDIHHRSISVKRLCFHLPNEKFLTFEEGQPLQTVLNNAELHNSKLEAFLKLCENDEFARTLTYQELPEYYVWHNDACFWSRRKKGTHYGRLNSGHYSTGEVWYLRMLLPRIRGPRSFQDLRTVDGVVYDTFKEACGTLGLLNDDKELHEALSENENTAFPFQLRTLFVYIIVNCQISDILKFWKSHWQSMSDDILNKHRKSNGGMSRRLTEQQLEYYTLAEIEKILNSIGKSIKNFPPLPMPPHNYFDIQTNRLVVEETSYDQEEMIKQHGELLKHLNLEQKVVYDNVLASVGKKDGKLFFVYGSGGCGKTFLWRTLITKLRSELKIVLPVASSGIAATLLPGGRTAHSRFKIPIKLNEESTCAIKLNSDIAELIKQTRLIIWDEAPMQNRYAFESLDCTLRDIMRSVFLDAYYKPFGGITILLGGDFRQILPVIPGGSRSDIVSASISRSLLWSICRIFYLKQNIRIRKGNSLHENNRIETFTKWVLDIGDGKLNCESEPQSDFHSLIKIPDEHCILTESADINLLIDRVFPEIASNYTDIDYIRGRAILTPTNKVVDHVNNLILDKISGEAFTYFSSDSAHFPFGGSEELKASFPVEILNSMKLPGMPPHQLVLKENVIVMLLRNINQALGLCNGTRMIVRKCQKHTIICEILSGTHAGTQHMIPRIEITPSDSPYTFTLLRLQFPLQICYVMTVNKAQGQSLELVGLHLPDSVFCRGQLYIAISRVTSPDGLTVFIEAPEGGTTGVTKNVMYEEIFYNL